VNKLRNHTEEECNTKPADRTITRELEELVFAEKKKICYSFRLKKLNAPAKCAMQDQCLKKNFHVNDHLIQPTVKHTILIKCDTIRNMRPLTHVGGGGLTGQSTKDTCLRSFIRQFSNPGTSHAGVSSFPLP